MKTVAQSGHSPRTEAEDHVARAARAMRKVFRVRDSGDQSPHDHSEIIHGRSRWTDKYIDGCLVKP